MPNKDFKDLFAAIYGSTDERDKLAKEAIDTLFGEQGLFGGKDPVATVKDAVKKATQTTKATPEAQPKPTNDVDSETAQKTQYQKLDAEFKDLYSWLREHGLRKTGSAEEQRELDAKRARWEEVVGLIEDFELAFPQFVSADRTFTVTPAETPQTEGAFAAERDHLLAEERGLDVELEALKRDFRRKEAEIEEISRKVADKEDHLEEVRERIDYIESGAAYADLKPAGAEFVFLYTAEDLPADQGLTRDQVEAIVSDATAALSVMFESVEIVSRAGDFDHPTATVRMRIVEGLYPVSMLMSGMGAGVVSGIGRVSCVVSPA